MAFRIRRAILRSAIFSAIITLIGCSSGSSSGVYNQSFNVSGHWSGVINDGPFGNVPISMTLADDGSAVKGNFVVLGPSRCFTGYAVSQLTGTSGKLPANSKGDNPLTADQENSNQGILVLAMEVAETVSSTNAAGEEEEEEQTYSVTFTLYGNANNTLQGHWGGTWIGPRSTCRYPGIQGTILTQRG